MPTNKRRNKNRNRSGNGTQDVGPSNRISTQFQLGSGSTNNISKVTRSGYGEFAVANGIVMTRGISFTPTGFYMDSTFLPWGGSGEPTALYDFYRLDRVQVTIVFNNNMSSIPGTTATLPIFFTCVDYNDATVSQISEILQSASSEMAIANASGVIATRTFTPRAQLSVYAGAGSAYAEAPNSMFFNTSATPIHYGMKLAVDSTLQSSSTGNNGYCRVFVKAFMSLKNPR